MNVIVWWSLGPSRDEWKEGGRENEKRGKRDAREKEPCGHCDQVSEMNVVTRREQREIAQEAEACELARAETYEESQCNLKRGRSPWTPEERRGACDLREVINEVRSRRCDLTQIHEHDGERILTLELTEIVVLKSWRTGRTSEHGKMRAMWSSGCRIFSCVRWRMPVSQAPKREVWHTRAADEQLEAAQKPPRNTSRK